MNGFMKKNLAMLCLAGGLGSVGCAGGERYRNLVDPCEQQRYAAEARQAVITCFTPQVQNGQILDQTIWNYQFEPGTDKLNPMGLDKLDTLVRRRPEPDHRIFIATARDLTFNLDKPDEYAEARRELDDKRAAAIQKYLAVQTAGRPMKFDVLIHDPTEPGMSAVSARNIIMTNRMVYTGSLGGGAGGAAFNTTGGATTGGGAQGGQQGTTQGGQPGGATQGGANTGGASPR
jgi:hypothetical protein